MLLVPDAVRVACWLNAWLSAREGADAVISGVDARTGRTEFEGPWTDGPVPTALFLGELRRLGVRRASSALPVPGDPLGLGGPAAFNAEVVDVGEAVLLHEPELGMVPVRSGRLVSWHVVPARPPSYLPTVGDADRALRAELLEAANRLAALDVATWRPEVADLLTTLRGESGDVVGAPYASARSARLTEDALRAAQIVSLARADDGGAVSAFEASQRVEALRPLERAARAALVATSSSLDGR